MHLSTLEVGDFRAFEQAELGLGRGWNLLVGANGAGKTSLLEAAFLLGHGRSFRPGPREALVRHGADGFWLHGRIEAAGAAHRVGLARNGASLEARLDGQGTGLGEMVQVVAVLYFGPGSQELVSGGGEARRRFLDWGVFHVEQRFLEHWRRYRRALKQRNALLRSGRHGGGLEVWDHELGEAAEPLTRARELWLQEWMPWVVHHAAELVPELGAPEIRFLAGYDRDAGLGAGLAVRHEQDRMRGHTGIGPHRADWQISFGGNLKREHLSRGQEKLVALACLLAQARLFGERRGEWPILCLDDAAAEIDRAHRARVFELIRACPAQVLASATEREAGGGSGCDPDVVFHVEHGRVGRLI